MASEIGQSLISKYFLSAQVVPGTKIATQVAIWWGLFTEGENIGESRFKGKVNEFGFRHFQLQMPVGQPAERWKFWSGA